MWRVDLWGADNALLETKYHDITPECEKLSTVMILGTIVWAATDDPNVDTIEIVRLDYGNRDDGDPIGGPPPMDVVESQQRNGNRRSRTSRSCVRRIV